MEGTADTEALTRRGLRLARFTVAYNVVECAVAVTAGVLAGLVSLVAFGIDAAVESFSAVLVSVRLAARLRRGESDEDKERRALRLIAVSFYALAAYVTVDGVRSLVTDEVPDQSRVGLGILVVSVVVMPALAAAKRRVGLALDDPLVLADAAETKLCVLLSASTLAGLVLFAVTELAWLDPAAGFVIALFAIAEGREAWSGSRTSNDRGPNEGGAVAGS